MRRKLWTHVLGALAITARQCAAEDDLPYNPTHIYLSAEEDDGSRYAYILQPDTDSTGQAQLLSLDVTKASAGESHTTIYSALPFLDANTPRAMVPVVDNSGNLTVIAGACSDAAAGGAAAAAAAAQVWTFAPDTSSRGGNGTWTQRAFAAAAQEPGPSYLSSGFAFAETVGANASETSLYVFGGMCPFANSTEDTWTTRASYSNQMLAYTPSGDAAVGVGNVTYGASVVKSSGPPVAEAGFSMTSLSASYGANTSTGQTQQQSFLIIGGQANGAFLNTSSLALFSLPQESWTFVTVEQPSSSKTELATRDTTSQVEPRSGHTAVLTEDGKNVVVFGGWVGDVSTPATPQLAVLDVGSGYGGDGDWAWTVPSTTGSANVSGSGLYGHGAVMLPGGVMMIAGGYSIASASTTTSRMFRRATTTTTTNSQTLFYNVSSAAWVSSYSPPASSTSTASAMSDTQRKGTLSTTGQKAGLGIGLAAGIILLVGLICYYFWYTRQVKRRRRAARESDKEGLVRHSNNSFVAPWLGHVDIDGRGGTAWNEKAAAAETDGYSDSPQDHMLAGGQQLTQPSRDVERSGIFVNTPSPTRGLRKGATTRAQYQYHAAPRYDDGRMSRGSGNIHPIEERDEESDDRLSSMDSQGRPMSPAERKLKALENILSENKEGGDAQQQDPFKDTQPDPLRSHPVSPEIGAGPVPPVIAAAGVERAGTNASTRTNGTDQVSNWIREWTASYAASMRPTSDNPASHHSASSSHAHSHSQSQSHSSSGRASPTKTDERTASNLSELSDRSGIAPSVRSAIARTSSTRSALFFGLSGTPSISPLPSPTEERFYSVPTTGRARSPVSPLPPQNKQLLQAQSSRSAENRPQYLRSNTNQSQESWMTTGTAQTTWAHLMAEGERLLGTASPTPAPLNPSKRRVNKSGPPPSSSSAVAESKALPALPWNQSLDQSQITLPPPHQMHDPIVSATASDALLGAEAAVAAAAPTRRNKGGWMGSIRRALGHDRNRSLSSSAAAGISHYPNLNTSGLPSDRSTTSRSPIKEYHENRALGTASALSRRSGRSATSYTAGSTRPKRAASDSSEFLKYKRGRRDWESDAGGEDPRWEPYRDLPDSPDLGDWGEGDVVAGASASAGRMEAGSGKGNVGALIPSIRVDASSPDRYKRRGSRAATARAAAAAASATNVVSPPPPPSSAERAQPPSAPAERNQQQAEPEQDDWDVEQAAAQRDVQVMFTLPKARLRVVNADVERASLRSVSGGSAQGSAESSGTGTPTHVATFSSTASTGAGAGAVGTGGGGEAAMGAAPLLLLPLHTQLQQQQQQQQEQQRQREVSGSSLRNAVLDAGRGSGSSSGSGSGSYAANAKNNYSGVGIGNGNGSGNSNNSMNQWTTTVSNTHAPQHRSEAEEEADKRSLESWKTAMAAQTGRSSSSTYSSAGSRAVSAQGSRSFSAQGIAASGVGSAQGSRIVSAQGSRHGSGHSANSSSNSNSSGGENGAVLTVRKRGETPFTHTHTFTQTPLRRSDEAARRSDDSARSDDSTSDRGGMDTGRRAGHEQQQNANEEEARRPSRYGAEIVEWERVALERRDRLEEEMSRNRGS